MCLALAACSNDESSSPSPTPPVASTPGQAASDVSTEVAAAEWKAVIEDWYVDGTFDSPHRCVAVQEAIKWLATSGPGYSSVYEDVRRLERSTCG